MKRVHKTLLVFLLCICCFNILAGYLVIGHEMTWLHKENGLLENMQVILLIVTMVAFFLQLYCRKDSHRIFPLAGAFLCLFFIFRELDVEKLDVPQILILLGSGTGRNILMSGVGAGLLIYAVMNFRTIRTFLPQFFFEIPSLTIFAGVLFLVSGWLFDKGAIDTVHHQFFEEILEVTGYYLMFAGAVIGSVSSLGGIDNRA